MSTITRTWIAFAALGTGTIHLALVIGAPLPLGIALGALGVTEVLWSLFAMAGSRLPAPRLALLGAMAPIVLGAVVLFAAVSLDAPAAGFRLPLLALAITAVLEFAIATAIAVSLRRSAHGAGAPENAVPHTGRYLVALLVAGMAVASLVTPALAATEAGGAAVPHGEHPGFFVDNGHSGH
ncbi:MAG: putative rane protein [Microbacteriaceae bacterium]|jgi:hypothetical protein|nr:putative rane protein [Microbacteriaceae bacterium]